MADPVVDAYNELAEAINHWVVFVRETSPASPDYPYQLQKRFELLRIRELFRALEQAIHR